MMVVPMQKILLISTILCAVAAAQVDRLRKNVKKSTDVVGETNDRIFAALSGQERVLARGPRPKATFSAFPEEEPVVILHEDHHHHHHHHQDESSRQLMRSCPSPIGNALRCQTGVDCVCNPSDLHRTLFDGTCHYCAIPDDVAGCRSDRFCKEDVSYCNSGVCTSMAVTPLVCPVLLNETIACTSDACECEAGTPNRAALITETGAECYVCHAKLDGEGCTHNTECAPSSFCDVASAECMPETTCSTRDSQGRFSCNSLESCECDATVATYKTSLSLDESTTCNICYEVADGDTCSETAECSPSSYCDEATKTCVDGSVCPVVSFNGTHGTYACITDSAACTCDGQDHNYKAAIPHSNMEGTFCHACAYDDYDTSKTCTSWTDCKPDSRCELADGTCVPDGTCIYTENGRCTSTTCTCPEGRTQKEHTMRGGGTCYSCEL